MTAHGYAHQLQYGEEQVSTILRRVGCCRYTPWRLLRRLLVASWLVEDAWLLSWPPHGTAERFRPAEGRTRGHMLQHVQLLG